MGPVVYEISLRDLFSQGIIKAEKHVNKLEAAIHQFKNIAVRTMESLGVSFAMFEGFEFMKDSVNEFHKLAQAQAQVKAGLESTQGAAGLTSEGLEEMAIKFRSHMLYSKAEIVDLQAQLLTFGGITKENFEGIAQATADVATKTHHGLTEMAIMMGKAMENPAQGLKKLMRAGVEFDAKEEKRVKILMAHGDRVGAQQVMMAEIANKYGKATQAAFDANPLARFHQKMEEVQEGLGSVLTTVIQKVTPAIEWLVDEASELWKTMKDVVHWFKENKKPIEDVGIAIGAAAVAWAGFNLVTKGAAIASAIRSIAWAVEAGALDLVAGAAVAVNAAFIASPIGWIVGGVALVTTGIIYLYNHFQTARGIITGVWYVMKAWAEFIVVTPLKVLYELGEAAANIFHPGKMLQHLNAAKDAVRNGAMDLATSFKKGYDEGIAGYIKDHDPEGQLITNYSPSLIKNIPKVTKNQQNGGEQKQGPVAKTSGTKNIRIDIKINQLIGKFETHTTTIQETAAKIRQHVTDALMSAVNDSQIVAGEH